MAAPLNPTISSQGFVLGPLLFLLYIDDLAQLPLFLASKTVLYADDLLLYRPLRGPNDLHLLQQDISSVSDWVNTNNLSFNVSKCKYMIITRKCKPSLPTQLRIESSEIERVGSYKDLGVLISSNLSFTSHIKSVCSKARRFIGAIYCKFYRNTNNSALLNLYTALVRPQLESASPVWRPYLHKDIDLLQNIEKFSLRMSTVIIPRGHSFKGTYKCTKTTPLETRRSSASLCMLYTTCASSLILWSPETGAED